MKDRRLRTVRLNVCWCLAERPVSCYALLRLGLGVVGVAASHAGRLPQTSQS